MSHGFTLTLIGSSKVENNHNFLRKWSVIRFHNFSLHMPFLSIKVQNNLKVCFCFNLNIMIYQSCLYYSCFSYSMFQHSSHYQCDLPSTNIPSSPIPLKHEVCMFFSNLLDNSLVLPANR